MVLTVWVAYVAGKGFKTASGYSEHLRQARIYSRKTALTASLNRSHEKYVPVPITGGITEADMIMLKLGGKPSESE